MQKTIDPVRGTLSAIVAQLNESDPIVMINLLRFRETADYNDGIECAGREAYATYTKQAFKKVKEAGGEVLYQGSIKGVIIAPAGEVWDEVLLVRYPSFCAFRDMVTNAEYRKISRHRTAALEDSRLMVSQS